MTSPAEKLAVSLQLLRALQQQGVVAVRSNQLGRTHRERLQRNGYLQEVMKGWYVATRPDERAGDSTAWYAAFWDYCAAYLNDRFGQDWSLSPEQSLALHTGTWTVPAQLLVRTPKGGNKPTKLPYETSIFDVRATLPETGTEDTIGALRVFSLPASLVGIGPGMFQTHATEVRAALAMIGDASEVLAILLNRGQSVVAGRLAGAFRNIGRDRVADDILAGMKAADYKVTETDPFADTNRLRFQKREQSPYVARIRLMWQSLRGPVINAFPAPSGENTDFDAYMQNIDEVYVTDAYHSLSIEGYRVSEDLVRRVRDGNWDPSTREDDRAHRDALAAKGYLAAFRKVRESVAEVLQGANAGRVADAQHADWYRELFSPSVAAGILNPGDLAGYRSDPVYIRQSMHVPPPREAVLDLMPTFFELLRQEEHPAVRIVLGHFLFVYIHPYMDGNGRMGRFLMNLMMAAGGYPWTVIRVNRRDDYMAVLEQASVHGNIDPFARFLAAFV